MISEQIFIPYDKPLQDIFSKELSYTFLVGAGISMDAPTNMPSARQFVRTLLSFYGLESEIEKMMNLPLLRYELVVEWVQKFFDPDLVFMNYFEHVIYPNLIHLFIARAILNHHYVITTNFDYLIEFALVKFLGTQKQNQVFPVITKQDFLASTDPAGQFKQNFFPLYKIHGSRKNIISGANTRESMITTLSSLGKEREAGQTFAIEPFKKPVMFQLLKDRTLVVFGYSGSDDFDISPMLKEMPFLKRLIWLDHANVGIPETFQITRRPSGEEMERLPRVEKFLCELHQTSDYEIILIRAPTKTFIERYLWSIFFSGQAMDQVEFPPVSNPIPPFHTWAKSVLINESDLARYQFTLQLYHELKELTEVQILAQKALEVAKMQSDTFYNGFFYNLLGVVNQISGDYKNALGYYKASYESEINNEDEKAQSSALNNMGSVYINLAEYDNAKSCFEKAFQCLKGQGQQGDKISSLNNLGYIEELIGNFQNALNYYVDAVRIAEKVGDLPSKQVILNNYGMVLMRTGKLQEAFEKFSESLHLADQLGDIYAKLIVQNNLARILGEKGDIQGALELFYSSLTLAEQLGDQSKKGGILSNIGSIFKAAGHLDEALERFQQALVLEQKVGTVQLLFKYWNNIGEIYLTQKHLPEAFSAFQQALQLAEKSRDKASMGVIMSKIGLLYAQAHQLQPALQFMEGAATLYKEIKDTENYAACLSNLVKIQIMAKNWEAALSCVTSLLEIDLQLKNPLSIASDYKQLGDIHLALKDVPNARINYQRAIDTLDQAHDEENSARLKEYVQKTLGH